MAALARYALPGIIILTSVGAFFMCLLVIRYGFGSREIELDDEEARRLVVTRIGHAIAAVCFAGAALLAVVALPARTVRPSTPVAAQPPAPPAPAIPTAALDEQAREIARLRDAIHQTQLEMDEKLAAVESRVANLAGRVSVESPAAELPPRSPAARRPASSAQRDDVSALPAGATGQHFRARVQGVSVDVQTRPIRDNETAYLVRLVDAANRPITGADVMLVGRRGDGSPILATLEPTNEPGVHQGRLPTPGEGADLRLRIVGVSTRFEVSLAREVSW